MLIKNLEREKKSEKFDYVKVKPFFIKAKIEIASYKVELFKNVKVHSVLLMLLLEPADFKTFI